MQRIMESTNRVTLAVCAVLLCFMSMSLSAPLACEDLLRPLGQLDLHHLEGRRVMVSGSLSHLPFMDRLRSRASATVNFSSNSDNDNNNLTFSRSSNFNNSCRYASYNISLVGSSFIFDNITTTFIHTSCHDCVLLSFDVESGKRQHFYLFSRRRQITQEEMEEFRAQVECLNMPPPAVMDPTKELCPEETSDQTKEETERQKN